MNVENLIFLPAMEKIKVLGFTHFLHENKTWQRLLDFYLQENAFLKTRLSEVLDINTGKGFVELAEKFQNTFLQNDEWIKSIRTDVVEMQQIFNKKNELPKAEEKKIMQKQKKLRNEVGYFEKQFTALKYEFNQYLISQL